MLLERKKIFLNVSSKNRYKEALDITIEGFLMVEITRLFWKKAVTFDNFVLGEVESAELDTSNWQIINLFVALSDEASKKMGFKHPYLGKVTVCLPVSTVDSVAPDKVMLNKKFEELRSLRQCRE
jgi:sporulation protein YlmC with PRC-barrel domain